MAPSADLSTSELGHQDFLGRRRFGSLGLCVFCVGGLGWPNLFVLLVEPVQWLDGVVRAGNCCGAVGGEGRDGELEIGGLLAGVAR